MAEEGFFLGLSPWSNVDVDMGFPVFYSPQKYFKLNEKTQLHLYYIIINSTTLIYP